MRIISLMPVGQVDHALLEPLAEGLTRRLRVACSIQPDGLEPEFAFNPLRRQYHSTEILKNILQRPASDAWKVLGVTEMDLYIPVLTFVFGEAQLTDGGAVVSAHRLRQEFYGLRHCPDYTCVMSSSNGIERIDLKHALFCSNCAQLVPTDEP